MESNRLEAFSDGVIAILITIMVLELRPPHGADLAALRPLGLTFLSYILSFIYLGIYWNNHHHLLKAARSVTGPILWANLHLLFWLSLVPFVTSWMGDSRLAKAPVAVYGLVLFMAAIAFNILERMLIRHEGPDSVLARAVGPDIKGWISLGFYISAVGISAFAPLASVAVYALVAAIWFIPDRRIERVIGA